MTSPDALEYQALAADYATLADSALATGAPDVAVYWTQRAHVARVQAERAARPSDSWEACPHGIRPRAACSVCKATP